MREACGAGYLFCFLLRFCSTHLLHWFIFSSRVYVRACLFMLGVLILLFLLFLRFLLFLLFLFVSSSLPQNTAMPRPSSGAIVTQRIALSAAQRRRMKAAHASGKPVTFILKGANLEPGRVARNGLTVRLPDGTVRKLSRRIKTMRGLRVTIPPSSVVEGGSGRLEMQGGGNLKVPREGDHTPATKGGAVFMEGQGSKSAAAAKGGTVFVEGQGSKSAAKGGAVFPAGQGSKATTTTGGAVFMEGQGSKSAKGGAVFMEGQGSKAATKGGAVYVEGQGSGKASKKSDKKRRNKKTSAPHQGNPQVATKQSFVAYIENKSQPDILSPQPVDLNLMGPPPAGF